jgi:uncharacterized protein YwgA
MTRYQLVKLVEWAGRLRSRKRLQKVVYLLQSAGCPIRAEFMLHLYGPYTHDLSNLSEEMVTAGLLTETPEQFSSVTRFSYELTNRAVELIEKYENDPERAKAVKSLGRYEPLAKELLGEDLKVLEIASTIAYFHDRDKDGNKPSKRLVNSRR